MHGSIVVQLIQLSWLIDWLIVLRHVNTEWSICANCAGRKPAQSAKDDQRDTMHNILRSVSILLPWPGGNLLGGWTDKGPGSAASSLGGSGAEVQPQAEFCEFCRHFQDKKLETCNFWGVGRLGTIHIGGTFPPEYVWNKNCLTLNDNNVTQFAVKHASYINATSTGYLIIWLVYFYASAFTNTYKPDPKHPIRYFNSLGADAV